MKFEIAHSGHNYFVVEAHEGGLLAACIFITPKSKDGNQVNAQVALHPDGPLWGTDAQTMQMLTGEAVRLVVERGGKSKAQQVAEELLTLPARGCERGFVSAAIRLAAAVGVKRG